jgi:hypothetical protein
MKARITRVSGKQEFDEVKERNFFNYVCFASRVNTEQRTVNVFHQGNYDLIDKIELIDCAGVVLETYDWSDKSFNEMVDRVLKNSQIKAVYKPVEFIY